MPLGPVSSLDTLAVKYGGEAIAFGLGLALGAALQPESTGIRQDQWSADPNRVLDPDITARLRAQGIELPDDYADEAKQSGINGDRFDALHALELRAPATGELIEMLRRKTITADDFAHGLRKAQLDPRYDVGATQLAVRFLDPADIARGIHRGLVADPGLLATEPPTGVGNVPAYPVYPIDAIAEASAFGYDKDRLGVLVGLQGNPMGPHEAAEATFRGVLKMDDYLRAIAEGNTRNEWAEAIFEQSRQIPTARDFLENALRGYTTLDDAIAGAELHGMTPEHATLIYQNQGRPMALTSITKALARGGKFEPEPGEITDPYMASIVEGSLKPGYYDLAKHLIYVYPSPFFMRALLQAGQITADDFAQYAKEQGWPPDLADKIAQVLAPSAGKTAGPHVTKAQTQLWTTTHSSYVNHWITDDEASTALGVAGVADDEISDVLTVWRAERGLRHAGLAATQIKKAVGEPGHDRAWALGRLAELGWGADDAATFLAE